MSNMHHALAVVPEAAGKPRGLQEISVGDSEGVSSKTDQVADAGADEPPEGSPENELQDLDSLTKDDLIAEYHRLRAGLISAEEELERVKSEASKPPVKLPKNHVPGKPSAGRKYVLLTTRLEPWGKVPQQQSDIADLLSRHMEIDREYTEAELFSILVDNAGDYPSLAKSKQDPTYLFRYYRGLKNDGKHAGLVARNFIRQVG